VLLSFNRFAVLVGFLSLLPVAVYPFMKRITDYPQFVLGLAFAWGALMGWACYSAALGAVPLLLYAGTIAWVIGYDTIYAIQDIEDDGIVGIRSTARTFGQKTPAMIGGAYLGAVLLMAAALTVADVGLASWLGLFAFACHLVWQLTEVSLSDGQGALRLFRSNRDAGLLLFAGILIDCFV
jgi:4-hydroxybenzoate polyprenyltransferase